MKKDAEAHQADDENKKKLVEARNIADQTVYTAEKSLRDYAEKIPQDLKTTIEGKIKLVQEVKDKDNLSEIQNNTQELSVELSKIGELLQANQSTDSSTSGDNQNTEPKEDSSDQTK